MDEQELFEHYVSIGAVEFDGMDQDGEPMYKVNDIAKDIAPELWEMHLSVVEDTVLDLFKKELIEIEYDEELNANIRLSPEGLEFLRENGYEI